ncbi:trypco2 family protein [Streptomyces phyllanthi]|uniref:Trypsin-co-occurring domain-containing protein n=1 Tax=Streptomyces phyllanthi TaxID=1803180 RepID=A0A5N8VYR0_9ACTN|nr:trypco2 family protein [Streptomyces phyllanthi]MPY39178.1 hypothetical protein [Streptomyces phyllanthi]
MVELARVIRDLREEVGQAIAAAEGEALRFELGSIELDLSVALESSGQAGAKVRFWVVESGADAAVRATSAQRVSLTLRPALAGADDPPYVSGRAGAHER